MSFNSLLKQEDQIWPEPEETLNATLRIFALMRLGVTEVESIAKILDYSISTVYTYKNRIKSKALIPPDEFEQKLMDVKFIDNKL
jgi:DNA-binding NarL/FixJ family response regulator